MSLLYGSTQRGNYKLLFSSTLCFIFSVMMVPFVIHDPIPGLPYVKNEPSVGERASQGWGTPCDCRFAQEVCRFMILALFAL